ncbi:DTW domain-containing protein [Bdellovibrio bacteriovorus]|uniref:tRNA-uridine aminocarboxypropyltransferase n=1 Tax=Bdellovibrio bacteriovorus TaxID=959 RepID=A0A150WET4_BDEBC|nr:DTW domain-containing protein [Bdellovibrio bacteriovorus]
MNVQEYLEQRKKHSESAPVYRELCTACIQPRFSCYCHRIQRFDPQIDFVILIHPIEVRRRIATGRMSFLCMENSFLIRGQDYSEDEQVNQILNDKNRQCVILYPGRNSKNLTEMTPESRAQLFDPTKKLTIFVIDGTWLTAKKMMRQSKNLTELPRICFNPEKPSNFRVRKQPHAACYSTLEAIHHTIELVGESQGFAVESRAHDRLLTVFDSMVELQLSFIRKADEANNPQRYRRPTFRA